MSVGFRRAVPQSELITSLLFGDTGRVSRNGVMYAGRHYSNSDVDEQQWTAYARNFGGWDIPCHHYPGSVSRIWTPNVAGQGLLDLKLSDQSTASRELTFDEVADSFAFGHPIRLLVAIDWLFSGAEDFLALHTAATDIDALRPANECPSPASRSDSDLARRARLAALLQSGASATAAATEVGVDVSTAMAWAAAEGIPVPRRPKILKGAVRTALVQCLRKGMDKQDAAGRHGISVETVTRLLHTEVGLHSAWKVARAAAAQWRARSAWQKLLRNHPCLGVKMLRAMDAASYAWLYRNDRAWLTEHTPAKGTSKTNPRENTVRWDERDLSLSGEVEKAVERLARPGRPLQLWQIYQAVPGLKPKLAVLHRLPLTQHVIERALGRRRVGSAPDLL